MGEKKKKVERECPYCGTLRLNLWAHWERECPGER